MLVLASASPRRRTLLQQLGVDFLCSPADIDETPGANEQAGDYVLRMARQKAAVAARNYRAPQYTVLAADTTVVSDREIMGKPRNRQD
ncbi:MAG: Maf family protein, partial [Halioglobus sp.]|nr:Maf family protein [Halioglobus sp.]